MTSARTDILGRYSKFFMSLKNSACYEVRVLANYTARDLRTTTGKNLREVRDASGLDPVQSSWGKLKAAIASREQVVVPPQDQWRMKYLWTLLGRVQEAKSLALIEEQKELQTLIDSLVK